MTARKVTRKQAEAVLKAIKEQFHTYIGCDPDPNLPVLVMDFDYLGYGPRPTVVWEEGPYEWAIHAFDEHRDPEWGWTIQGHEKVDGVWTEPMTSWALSIYLDDEL